MRIAFVAAGQSAAWSKAPEAQVVPIAVEPPAEAVPKQASSRDVVVPVEQRADVGDRPRSHQKPAFDPPLIAQRAALGLPVGSLISGYAQDAGITWSMADARVQAATAALQPPPSA